MSHCHIFVIILSHYVVMTKTTWIQFLGRASIEERNQVAATTLLAWDTVHTRLPASS